MRSIMWQLAVAVVIGLAGAAVAGDSPVIVQTGGCSVCGPVAVASPCATPCETPCATPCETPCATPCETPCATPCETPCATPCESKPADCGGCSSSSSSSSSDCTSCGKAHGCGHKMGGFASNGHLLGGGGCGIGGGCGGGIGGGCGGVGGCGHGLFGGFAHCVTPIMGTGGAGCHTICVYGSYNLR